MHQSVWTFWWILYCIPNIEASTRAHCLRGPNNCDPDGYAGAAAVQRVAWHPWAIIAQRFIFINSFFVIIPRHFYDIAPLVLDQNVITFAWLEHRIYMYAVYLRGSVDLHCVRSIRSLLSYLTEQVKNAATQRLGQVYVCILFFVYHVMRDYCVMWCTPFADVAAGCDVISAVRMRESHLLLRINWWIQLFWYCCQNSSL